MCSGLNIYTISSSSQGFFFIFPWMNKKWIYACDPPIVSSRFPHLKFQVLEMRTRNAQWCFAIFLGGIFHFATMTVSCWVHSMMNLFTHFCCHPGHGCVSFPSQLQATHLGTLMLAPRTVWIGRRRLNTRTKLLRWLGWTHQHVLKLSGATCSHEGNILEFIPFKSPLFPLSSCVFGCARLSKRWNPDVRASHQTPFCLCPGDFHVCKGQCIQLIRLSII